MATVEKHIDQWKHNRSFVRTVDSRFPDWQITAIFYTALHLIDAALVKLNIGVSDHSERNDKVRQNASFAAVRKECLNLYRISRITRYDADPDQWIPKEYLTTQDMAEQILKPIENGLVPLLGKAVEYRPLKVEV